MGWRISIFLIITCLTSQSALKVMTIGDSLTNEYAIQLPFSAPDSNPSAANTMNWVEILAARRDSEIGFGDYSGLGHEYNWGISGYDTIMWMGIIHAGLLDPEFIARAKMWEHYDEVDVVVVMLGGNDVRSRYGDLYDATPGDATATSFINTVITNLEDVIDEIQSINSSLPIVLANVPDLGATPDKIADHPDPLKRANASAIIKDLNTAVASLATSKGATLAPISQLTDQILKPETYYIGALPMVKDKHPENPPTYLFCKGGLHPSTNGQARIANTLLTAINAATSSNINLLPDREIITHLLGLNPDQPFIDWANNAGLPSLSMTADTDGDGIPNLGEYLLGLNPWSINQSHLTTVQQIGNTNMLTMSYTPDTDAARLAGTVIKQSTDLSNWSIVPQTHIHAMGDGSMQVRLPLSPNSLYVRMEFQLLP